MSAAYDSYDYPSYWEGREYEHKSEVFAIKSFLGKIPKIKKIVDLGAGFGRLTPAYLYRAKNIILIDPSARLLKEARKKFSRHKKIRFIRSSLENLGLKVKGESVDLIIMVRVLHHIKDIETAFTKIHKLLKGNGYFILEFANKRHWKETFKQFLRGNFTFPLDIFRKDMRSKKSLKEGTLPFFNFHPYEIEQKLKDFGFEIVEKRSVSNIRSDKIKKYFSLDFLTWLEELLQKPLSFVDFGPSVFMLARKKG